MRRRRAAKTVGIATTAAALYALVKVAEPYVAGATMSTLRSGNITQLPTAFAADSKNALQPSRLLEAATPYVTVRIATKVLGWAGISAPKVGRLRAW